MHWLIVAIVGILTSGRECTQNSNLLKGTQFFPFLAIFGSFRDFDPNFEDFDGFDGKFNKELRLYLI